MTTRKKRRAKPEQKRLDENSLDALNDIFPGFATWYRQNYDEDGAYRGLKIPGLTPKETNEPPKNGI